MNSAGLSDRFEIMKNRKAGSNLKNKLEELYNYYNRREFVHPDPLEFLYNYDDIKDRELVAIIASSLAYGRVAQILKSVSIKKINGLS